MIRWTAIGGKFKEINGCGSILVTVMKTNKTAVKFLLQRCVEDSEERKVHRVIVDYDPSTHQSNMTLIGEQKQSQGEFCQHQPVVKRMVVKQFKGFDGTRSVDITVEEFRFPRSLNELRNLPEKYRRCFASTYTFKRVNGEFQLSLTLKDCYRGLEIKKEFAQVDNDYRKYAEPPMCYHSKIILSEDDVASHILEDMMPDEEDYIINLVPDEIVTSEMSSQDDVYFPVTVTLSQIDPSIEIVGEIVVKIIDRAVHNSRGRSQKLVKNIIEDVIQASCSRSQSNRVKKVIKVPKMKRSLKLKYLKSASADLSMMDNNSQHYNDPPVNSGRTEDTGQNPYLDIILDILDESDFVTSEDSCDDDIYDEHHTNDSPEHDNVDQSNTAAPDDHCDEVMGDDLHMIDAPAHEDVVQNNAAVPNIDLPESPRRTAQVLRHLGSSSAKKKQKKLSNCVFCHTECSRHNLEQHLTQSYRCALLYQRKLHCKNIPSTMALLFDCLFCDKSFNRLFYHLDSEDNEECLNQYRAKFELDTAKEISEKVSSLKRVKFKSRQSLSRKIENEKSKKSKRQKLKNESIHTFINLHQSRTLFSNFRLCISCSCHILAAEELTESHDLVTSGVISLEGKEKFRRNSTFWICNSCKENDVFPSKMRQPNVQTFHLQLNESDLGHTFVPRYEVTERLVPAPEEGEDIILDTRDSSIMFPISIVSCDNLDRDQKLLSLSSFEIQRLLYQAPEIDNKSAGLLYENMLIKYWRAKYDSDFFTGRVLDHGRKALSSVKQVSKEKTIAGSLAWRRSQEEEIGWKMWQLGSYTLQIGIKFCMGDLQSIATELVKRDVVVSASLIGEPSGEQTVKYYVHVNHSNETLCDQHCIKIPLSEYLTENPINADISTFISSVEQSVNSLITNLFRSPASFINSSEYHFNFAFEKNGNILLNGLVWPDFLQNLNTAACEPTMKEEIPELKEDLLQLLKNNLSCSTKTDVLSDQLKLPSAKVEESVGLIEKLQVDILPENMYLPSLEWGIRDEAEMEEDNKANCQMLVTKVRSFLMVLSQEKIQSTSTIDWLQELWSEVEESEIIEPNIWKFKLRDVQFVFKLTDRVNSWIEKYQDLGPFISIYQYSLMNIENCREGSLLMRRSHLIDAFTTPFYLPLLKATKCPVEVKFIARRQEYTSKLLEKTNITDCQKIGLEGHGIYSLVEAYAFTDSNKLKVKCSSPIEFVYTGPDPRSFFKKVPSETETSFTIEGVQGFYELQPSPVSRFFKRENGRMLLFCEFISDYEYVGKEKSSVLYEVYCQKKEKIELSDQHFIRNDMEFLPSLLLLSNGDVMQRRKSSKCLKCPNFRDDYSNKYSDVLLFSGEIESEEDLQQERVLDLFNQQYQETDETKVHRNKRLFLKKMRLSR